MILNRSKQGTYYLGRVIFIGSIDKQKFVEALRNPVSIESGEYSWTITDFKQYDEKEGKFIFGKLTKYQPRGKIDIVDTKAHAEKEQDVENSKIASSPFVYIPEYSGIAYLHVWNQIEPATFVRRFTSLIKEKYNNFMLECGIEAISDIQTFYKRIGGLTSIDFIQARVHPPNPLFGPLWRSLKDYLEKRKAAEFKLEEKAKNGAELKSKLKELILKVESENDQTKTDIDITDAAILMATDGYGQGRVEGTEGKKKIIIRTSDTTKNFKFDSDPDPWKLYEKADSVLKEINVKRHMEHDKKD